MYYKLPEDIRKTIYELEESYPFFKPERFRKSYYKHLRNYHKRGFWSAITWGTKPRRHSLYLCGSKTRQPRCC